MVVTILSFIIILSILVLVHEAGHFITAKLLKIKVEEFGYGIPPRLFGKKIGDTIYSINWLPIGGFVKLYGEDEAGSGSISLKKQEVKKEDEKNAYYSRPKWQKAIVVASGVFMNFVLAVILLSYLYSFVGVPKPIDKVTIAKVIEGSPAQAAGLKEGDLIETFKGEPVKNTQQLIELARVSEGTKVEIKIKNSEGERIIKLTPRKTFPKNQGPMGVVISQEFTTKKYPWYQAPFVGLKEALNETWLIASGLFGLLAQLITKGVVPQDVAGPVGIAQLTGQVVAVGPYAILSFVSLLSLNLALINILPIPALDGGRLFFIILEAVTRKKVNPVIEGYAHTIGMAILLGLIALITLHDLFRIFSGQPLLPR